MLMTPHPKDVQQILSLALEHGRENLHREEILALRKGFFPFPSHMQALWEPVLAEGGGACGKGLSPASTGAAQVQNYFMQGILGFELDANSAAGM